MSLQQRKRRRGGAKGVPHCIARRPNKEKKGKIKGGSHEKGSVAVAQVEEKKRLEKRGKFSKKRKQITTTYKN